MSNKKIKCLEAEEKENARNWQGALDTYQEIATEEQNDIEILSKIGWCQSRLGEYKKAINTFKKIVDIDPRKAKWSYMVGYQYYAQKDWQNAIIWFKKALEIYPKYFIVKYRLAYALIQVSGVIYRLKRPEYLEALKHLEDCEIIWRNMPEAKKNTNKSTFADVCFQKGKIYNEREDWVRAIECFKKAILLKPNFVEAQYQLAKSLNNNGETKESLKFLPKNSSKYYIQELKADIYFKIGKINESLEIAFNCLKNRKKDYILRHISEIYLYKKDSKNAHAYSKKAIVSNKNNHKNHFILGKVYYSLGLLFRAKEEIKLAIQLKKERYDSKYLEAIELLKAIDEKIIESDYIKDDEKLLASLEQFSIKKNKYITGKIYKYNSQKGYGFIKSNSESVFFHICQIPKEYQKNIRVGLNVIFKIENTKKGLSAKDIKIGSKNI